MQAYMYEMICVQLIGPLDALLPQVDPNKYEKNHIRKWYTVHIPETKNSHHGTLQAALLFWKYLTGTF